MLSTKRGAARSAFLVCELFALVAATTAHAQLSPEAELKTLVVAPEMEVSLFASEPLLTNPAAIDVDTQGRVWVAEIEFYRGGAKTPPADKIKVLEDTDGDGRADRVSVFAEGLFAPMSICVAGSKVFVATSPDLWMYEDANGDLKADGPPQKLLTGFGGYNHDHGAHSLVLGPDHKWWMSHGDTGFDVRGADGSRAKYQWGGVLRGELDGSQLETVAVNFRNPYEVCVSSFGEAYLSDNDNDGNESARICWIMDGGNYGWFGGPPFGKQELDERVSPGTPFREHWHFRGYMPGFVPATLVTGFGSPTGICFYEGDAFGLKFKNAPLHTDAGPRECRAYRHELAGHGMRATSEVFLSNQGDNYFRPDDICAGPDGRLFVSDWYDGGVGGHGYNNPDQGRIFVLSPKGRKLTRKDKPGPYANTADAIEGLKSPNLATQFLARQRLLADGQQSVPKLVALLKAEDPNVQARALWLLDRIGGEARENVMAQLKNSDRVFRALAVRILRRHGEQYAGAILTLAGDSDPEVRREVLLALRTLKGEAAEAALATLAATYDGSDRYLLEAIHIAAVGRQEKLLASLEQQAPLSPERFQLLQVLSPDRAAQSLLARLKQGDLDDKSALLILDSAASIPSAEAGWGLLELAQNAKASTELRRAALDKLVANLDRRGSWISMLADKRLATALHALNADASMRTAALTSIGRLRIGSLAGEVLAAAKQSDLDAAVRVQAIDVLVDLKPRGAIDVLRGLLADPDPKVSAAALRGLIDLQDARSLREVLASDRFSADTRRDAIGRLVDSSGGAIVLLRLIDENQLNEDFKAQVIAKATTHPDVNVRVLFDKFVPEDQRPRKLGQAIAADEILALSGDVNRGRVIFDKSSAAQCKKCHAVQGFGGSLGPELTNIGKKYERKVLLETIIDPSKAIAPEFVPQVLETKGGAVYAGFVVERTPKFVVLKDINSKRVRVSTEDIEVLVPQPKSLMPELVLSEVTAQDAADLLAYLMTLK